MTIEVLNPLADKRWDDLVACHPRASVFHERGWLEALARTYGYEPFVLTSTPAGGPLKDGLVVCLVSSWMTGNRLVSLPFSDHCDPLTGDADDPQGFVKCLRTECDDRRARYVELRPLGETLGSDHALRPAASYWFHELDIRPSLEEIFERFHKNSFQRKILRAEREQLSYEAGRSQRLLDEFYKLLLTTRRRHQLLPQPRIWFRNLVQFMGDKLEIRVARKDDTPIAAILTLRHGPTAVYKYGCSDEGFHNLGGMPLLFWRMIEESKALGAQKIDFGRTDLDNGGLLAFKDRFGTSRKLLTYYRYNRTENGRVASLSDSPGLRQFFSILPETISSTAGRILYRHLG